jgi:hypothetical protein
VNITPIELAERVELWQNRLAPLGVNHFRIECITYGSPPVERLSSGGRIKATASVETDYDSVYFLFNDEEVEQMTPRKLDETIVHEWMHVATRDLAELQSRLETWMPAATFEDYHDGYKHIEEGLIDRLARLIVSLYYAPKRASVEQLDKLYRTTN